MQHRDAAGALPAAGTRALPRGHGAYCDTRGTARPSSGAAGTPSPRAPLGCRAPAGGAAAGTARLAPQWAGRRARTGACPPAAAGCPTRERAARGQGERAAGTGRGGGRDPAPTCRGQTPVLPPPSHTCRSACPLARRATPSAQPCSRYATLLAATGTAPPLLAGSNGQRPLRAHEGAGVGERPAVRRAARWEL